MGTFILEHFAQLVIYYWVLYKCINIDIFHVCCEKSWEALAYRILVSQEIEFVAFIPYHIYMKKK